MGKEEKQVEAPKGLKFNVGHGGQEVQPGAPTEAKKEEKEIEHDITNTTRSHSRKG